MAWTLKLQFLQQATRALRAGFALNCSGRTRKRTRRRNQGQGQQKQRLARSFLTGPFFLVEKAAKGDSMLQAMHTRANTPAPGQTLRARFESFDTLVPPQACRREAK